MDLGLTDRRALITGGSQGVGKAIARGFLAEGAKVVIVSRDQARLHTALAELAALGPVEGRTIDLSQRGAPEAVADEFRDAPAHARQTAESHRQRARPRRRETAMALRLRQCRQRRADGSHQ